MIFIYIYSVTGSVTSTITGLLLSRSLRISENLQLKNCTGHRQNLSTMIRPIDESRSTVERRSSEARRESATTQRESIKLRYSLNNTIVVRQSCDNRAIVERRSSDNLKIYINIFKKTTLYYYIIIITIIIIIIIKYLNIQSPIFE